MNTIDASKNKWPYIYNQLGLPPITGGSHYKKECPICDRKHSFRCDDRSGDGDWICTCGSGKGIGLIQEVYHVGFAEACNMVDKIIGNKKIQPPEDPNFKSKETLAEEEFQKLFQLQNSDAQKYLQSRGIFILPENDVLRYSGSHMYDYSKKISFPCIIAKVLSHGGIFSYKHLTFIVGSKKIEIEPQRKLIAIGSEPKGAAIRLFNHKDVLGIAEGIETALSAKQIYGFPVWCLLNTSLMKKFVCPEGVKKLIIYTDNDKNLSGQAAAFECGRRNMLLKNNLKEIIITWPAEVDDFNDVLLQKKFKIITQKFIKNDTSTN